MSFKFFDALPVFDTVARKTSITAAARELHLSKGAVSYQIKKLEQELGFRVFHRKPGGVVLTDNGRELWHSSQAALQQIRQEIRRLRDQDRQQITVGMSTYFASRWLSPRLMNFTSRYPQTGLRLQPTIGLVDPLREDIDMVIRWGNGNWDDLHIERLFECPAVATAGAMIAGRIEKHGLETVLEDVTLLHDFEGSISWRDWHRAAGLPYRMKQNDLVIEDPNVRVQAVIDGQGLALNDRLVDTELCGGQLFRVSEVRLEDYGYFLAYPAAALANPALRAFRDWITGEDT